MTNKTFFDKSKHYFTADLIKILLSILMITLAFVLSICFGEVISIHTKEGLLLSYNIIIPAVFPYMILSDLLICYVRLDKINVLKRFFSRFLKISPAAINAYFCGLICGFPIGVKLSRDLYLSGSISKEECERLIGFSNNPSPAFLIGGIGFSLRGRITDGIILFIANMFASLLVAVIFASKEQKDKSDVFFNTHKFSLVNSIKDASVNTLSTCGFITFFSVVLGIISILVRSDTFMLFISPFLEITNASKIITKAKLTPSFAISIAAFSASSSGLSVLLQSKSLLIGTDISMKNYYPIKILCGIISATFAFLLSFIK